MPRQSKGARLWLQPERLDPGTGKVRKRATWIIRDGDRFVATGCAAGEAGAAEERLAEYIQTKYRADRRAKDIDRIDVADVLALYDEDRRERQANKAKFDERMKRLTEWWGGRALSEVTGETCRAYAKHRVDAIEAGRKARARRKPRAAASPETKRKPGGAGGARRDLEDLRAAINHHAAEGLHRGVVKVVLPEKGVPRDRWLTRDEAARLLWTCWRYREVQTVHRGPDKGARIQTDKRPLRHVARFILLGLYTGSRAGAIACASPYRAEGRSFVDLDRGVFYRLAEGKRETKKRQPPVPLPEHLLAHMRRWVAKGIAATHFVEWQGKPVASVKTGFASAVRLAKLEGAITPHTLRHTAATWLMQQGVPIWTAAGFLGMSEQVLREVYGHHHPDHLKEAVQALSKGRRRSVGDRPSAGARAA